MKLVIDIVMKRIYLFNIVAWNYRKKIGFPVCKKENFAGLQAHRKRGKSTRASPTPHHTLNEERSARFTAQHLSALMEILRIVAWSKPRMFCQESLGKIKLRAFPKRVGPRILSLENVDYLEQVNTSNWWKNKIWILINKTAMVGCCNLSLYTNGLVMSMRFIFGDDWNDCYVNHFFDLWQWSLLFLSNRGPWIFVYLYTRIACDRRRYFRSSLKRILNPFRNK